MNDAKPLASLSPSLLARKGHARPAMRPQAMILDRDAAQGLEDLGWNDMGEDAADQHKAHLATVSTLTPMAPSPAQEQQVELARAFEEAGTESEDWDDQEQAGIGQQVEAFEPQPGPAPAPRVVAPVVTRAPIQRAAPGSRGKSAFTLRLDADRHLRLRVHAAISHRSAQHIVTQALDEFLERQASDHPFSLPGSAA